MRGRKTLDLYTTNAREEQLDWREKKNKRKPPNKSKTTKEREKRKWLRAETRLLARSANAVDAFIGNTKKKRLSQTRRFNGARKREITVDKEQRSEQYSVEASPRQLAALCVKKLYLKKYLKKETDRFFFLLPKRLGNTHVTSPRTPSLDQRGKKKRKRKKKRSNLTMCNEKKKSYEINLNKRRCEERNDNVEFNIDLRTSC